MMQFSKNISSSGVNLQDKTRQDKTRTGTGTGTGTGSQGTQGTQGTQGDTRGHTGHRVKKKGIFDSQQKYERNALPNL